jgi:hypothetical protein
MEQAIADALQNRWHTTTPHHHPDPINGNRPQPCNLDHPDT